MRGVILYLCDRLVVGDALSRSLCYNVNCVLKSMERLFGCCGVIL